MAKIQDMTVTVLKETDDMIIIKVGDMWQVNLTKQQLADYADPSVYDPLEMILRNMALRLRIDNIDVLNKGDIALSVDKVSFKAVI